MVVAAPVYAATSSLSQGITGGVLQVTAPGGITALQNVSVGLAPQTASGTINNLLIEDSRGTGAGWTLSAGMQNLTFTKPIQAKAGNTSPLITLNTNSRYDGTCGVTSPNTIYTITITTGGSVGTAQYSVTNGCAGENLQTNVITATTNNPVGSKGLIVDFPAGSYVINNAWTIVVDVFPYTGVTITPQTPTEAVGGSGLDGLTVGTAGIFAGTSTVSNSRIMLSAGLDKGMGSYYQNINLDLSVHANSYAGTYAGTIIFTIL